MIAKLHACKRSPEVTVRGLGGHLQTCVLTRAPAPSTTPAQMQRLALLVVAALATETTTADETASWEGDFYDPDDLKITLRTNGNELVAHSVDWEINGEITGASRAQLAGLTGMLSRDGISWSNGVVWSRAKLPVLAPPTWSGHYHATKYGIDVTISVKSHNQVEAVSPSFHSPASGRVSGDTISLFGLTGKLRAGLASDGWAANIIDWSNGETWTKVLSSDGGAGPGSALPLSASANAQPMGGSLRPPPPPPLLAAGTPGAGPDYFAADFQAASTSATGV